MPIGVTLVAALALVRCRSPALAGMPIGEKSKATDIKNEGRSPALAGMPIGVSNLVNIIVSATSQSCFSWYANRRSLLQQRFQTPCRSPALAGMPIGDNINATKNGKESRSPALAGMPIGVRAARRFANMYGSRSPALAGMPIGEIKYWNAKESPVAVLL